VGQEIKARLAGLRLLGLSDLGRLRVLSPLSGKPDIEPTSPNDRV
jgi:hypothetical protein